MKKCDAEIGPPETIILPPPQPPEKKQKLMSPLPPPEKKQKPWDSSSDDDDIDFDGAYDMVDSDDDDLDLYERLRDELRLDDDPVALDTVTHAKRIFVDPQLLQKEHISPDLYLDFLHNCCNRNTLLIYDHPGDPRMGGHVHWEADKISERLKSLAKCAVDCYNEVLSKEEGDSSSKLTFVGLDKVSSRLVITSYDYLTFRARDERTNEVMTYQAQIMELRYDNKFILGMLRDVANDKVLAITQLIEEDEGSESTGSEEDAATTTESEEDAAAAAVPASSEA